MTLPLRRCKQLLAGLLSNVLIVTSFPVSQQAHAIPVVLQQIQLPEPLGFISESHKPEASKLVLLIQDLHLHYPTQKRILKILQHLEKKQMISGKIAVEGFQGDYDTSNLSTLPAGEAKEKLVEYFLKKGELSGDEAFAVLRGESHRLYGVDDANYYQLNRELYKATFQSRKALQAHLAQIEKKLRVLKKAHYTLALRRLDRIERYDVASAEEILKAKLEISSTIKDADRALVVRHIAEIDHSLYFLTKLLNQQTTLEEVRYLAQRLPHLVQLTQSLLKLEKSTWNPTAAELEETLKSAVDFYAVALMRDKPLVENTLQLLQKQPKVALIAGGFHTSGMIDELKNAGVGYVVITPNVQEAIGEEYHHLYEKRVVGETLSADEVARDFKVAPVVMRSLKVISPLLVKTAAARSVIQTAWRGVQGRQPTQSEIKNAFATAHASWLPSLSDRLKRIRGWQSLPWMIGAGVMGLGAGYALGWVHNPMDALHWVGESLAVAGLLPLSSPFKTLHPRLKRLPPRAVKGSAPGMFQGQLAQRFSLMEAETVAATAAIYKQGLIGLAGKIKPHFSAELTTQDNVVAKLQAILNERGSDWNIPHATRDNILRHARESKDFKPKDPFKLVVSAIKDVADAASKDAVTLVNEKIFSRTTRGMKRFFAASEGLGRDALEDGEAFGAGEVMDVPSARSISFQDDLIERIEQQIGLQREYFTVVDVLEGTNAAVGVTETGVLYKAGDALPAGVRVIDISGATSVSMSVSGAREDLNVLNADDGYAHLLATFVPATKRALFEVTPLDPDAPEISFKRILQALGNLKPSDIEVVVMNRPREKKKIEWLSERGYNVSLIPDGTLAPSVYASLAGRFESGKPLVLWTTSGAPESRWGQSAERALSAFGAVGGVRLYPKKMANNPDWMGKAGLTDAELTAYQEGTLDALAMAKRGTFTPGEIDTYKRLHPQDWQDIVQGKRLFSAHEIQGDIDGAIAFVTNNKVFNENGIQPISPNEVEIRVLRVRNGQAWIETLQGNVDDFMSGEAFIAELDQLFTEKTEDLVVEPGWPRVSGGSGEHGLESEILDYFKEGAHLILDSAGVAEGLDRPGDIKNIEAALNNLVTNGHGLDRHNGFYFLRSVRDTAHDFDVVGGQDLRLPSAPDNSIQKYLSMPLGEQDRHLLTNMVRDYDFRSRDSVAPSPKLWFVWGVVWAQMALAKSGHLQSSREVVLARDTRKIEPELIEALAAGLSYAGMDVVYVGQDTPNAATSYATALAEVRPLMGILITSSHVTSPDDIQIRGAKVSILDQTGVLASLTTEEIKQESRKRAEELISTPASLEKAKARTTGQWEFLNPNANNVRWNTLVGRVAYNAQPGRTLFDLKQDNEKKPLDAILEDWKKEHGVSPLKGVLVTLDGAHTPTGPLAAQALASLGAQVDLIHGDIKALTGMHKADPSKLENLEALKSRMRENGSLIGFTFDLDGDRLVILVKDEKGNFVELPPDNLAAALMPFLTHNGGFNSETTGRFFASIRDVLSTEGVDDVAQANKVQSHATDAGYPFLKARGRELRAQGVYPMIMGERSGHAWLLGEFENPIEVAVTFAVMAMKFKEANPDSANPFYDVFKVNTVPYLQSVRFQPPFHASFLQKLGENYGQEAGWTYAPGATPNQRIIARGRDEALKIAAGYFSIGKGFTTPAGRLTVSQFKIEDEASRKVDGLHRYADIAFVDESGQPAGHFVLRASANDPTFVASYETKVRGDAKDLLRYQAVGGVVLDFLGIKELAYVEGPSLKDKNTLVETAKSLEPYREYLSQQSKENGAKPVTQTMNGRGHLLFPNSISNAVQTSLNRLQNERLGEIMIAGSEGRWDAAGLFAEIGKDPAPRLGWVQAAKRILENNLLALSNPHSPLAIVQKILASQPKYAIFAGMGGSSLAIKLLLEVFGQPKNGPHMFYLDTTDPTALRRVQEEIYRLETGQSLAADDDFTAEQKAVIEKALKENTQAVAITKSATTAETLSHMRFLAGFGVPMWLLTDPQKGTDPKALPAARQKVLDVLAAEKIQMNPENIFWIELDGNIHHGGRFSAPATNVYLVAAAMIGLPVEQHLEWAESLANLQTVHKDAFFQLAAILDALDRQGKDHLTFLLPKELQPFASWVEQLIEESVGKNGQGITIFYDEDLTVERIAPAGRNDRVFLNLTVGDRRNPFAERLREAGYPVVNLDLPTSGDDVRNSVPALMYGFERMVAAFSYLKGINFVNQPGVQNYKLETKEILKNSPVRLPQATRLPSIFGQWTLNIDELIANGVFNEAEIRAQVERMNADVQKAEHVYAALLWLAEEKGLLKNGEFALFGTAPAELMQTLRDARTEIFNDLQQRPGKVGRREQDNHSTEQNKGAGKPGTFSTFLVTEEHPKPIVGDYSDDVIKASAIGTVRSRTKQGRAAVLLSANQLDEESLKDLRDFFKAVSATLRSNPAIPSTLSGNGRLDSRFNGKSATTRILSFIAVLTGGTIWGVSQTWAATVQTAHDANSSVPWLIGAGVLGMSILSSNRVSQWIHRFRQNRAERRHIVKTMTPQVQKMSVPAMGQVQPESVPTPPSSQLMNLVGRWIPVARRSEAGSALSRSSRLLMKASA